MTKNIRESESRRVKVNFVLGLGVVEAPGRYSGNDSEEDFALRPPAPTWHPLMDLHLGLSGHDSSHNLTLEGGPLNQELLVPNACLDVQGVLMQQKQMAG
jgi:hypothetical protein